MATMGDARMFIFDGVDEDWAATVLRAMGSVRLPHADDVLKTVDDAGVKTVDVRWDGGELDQPVDLARGALPHGRTAAQDRLHDGMGGPGALAGGRPAARRGVSPAPGRPGSAGPGGPRHVDPAGAGHPLTALARTGRGAHRCRRGEELVRQRAAGRPHLLLHASGPATKGPHSREVDVEITQTWNSTAQR